MVKQPGALNLDFTTFWCFPLVIVCMPMPNSCHTDAMIAMKVERSSGLSSHSGSCLELILKKVSMVSHSSHKTKVDIVGQSF